MNKSNTKKTKNSTQTNKNKVCKSEKKTTNKKTTKKEKENENTPQLSPRFLEDGERVRSVAVELYASPTHWGALLNKASNYAYILHDKDIKSDGTPKTSHYHVLLHFTEAHTKSAIRKMTNLDSLETDNNMLFQKLTNPHGAFKYLTHDTKKAQEDNKVKYDEKLIVSNDLLYWQDCINENTSPNQVFLDDLLNDKYSHYNLAVKYGRDYMKNYRAYMDFKNEVEFDTKRENIAKLRKELWHNLDDCENSKDEDKTPYDVLVEYIADLVFLQYENKRGCSRSSLFLKQVYNEYIDELDKDVLKKLSEYGV